MKTRKTLEQRVKDAWARNSGGFDAGNLLARALPKPLRIQWRVACARGEWQLRTLQRIDLRFARLADAERAKQERGGA